MAKKSFVLYTDYAAQLELLNMEQRGRLFTAVLNHVLGDDLPDLDGVTMMAFSFIRSQLDRDIEKYNETCEIRKEAGRKGGLAKASKAKQTLAKGSKAKQNLANLADNDNDNDTDNDNDKAIGAEPKAPAPEEQPIITIPLNDGSEYPVNRQQFNEWITLYPAVDVLAELRKMRGWCLENKAKRKTARGIGRFIVGWLSREQDKPHKEFSSPAPKPMTRFHNMKQRDDDIDEYTAAMMRNLINSVGVDE